MTLSASNTVCLFHSTALFYHSTLLFNAKATLQPLTERQQGAELLPIQGVEVQQVAHGVDDLHAGCLGAQRKVWTAGAQHALS